MFVSLYIYVSTNVKTGFYGEIMNDQKIKKAAFS